MVVGDQRACGLIAVPGEEPEIGVEVGVAEQPRLPGVERLFALAEVVLESLVHGVVHDVLVDVHAKRPDDDALGDRQYATSVAEVGGHAVDGARQRVAVPEQQVALGAIDSEAEDVEQRSLVASRRRHFAAAALGQVEQALRQSRLVVLGVYPQVGLQLAGAELVADVRIADQAPVADSRDPRVAGQHEALHVPVAFDVVGDRVGVPHLGHVAGVEQVDDLGQVAARGWSDVAGGGAHGAMVRELLGLDEHGGALVAPAGLSAAFGRRAAPL